MGNRGSYVNQPNYFSSSNPNPNYDHNYMQQVGYQRQQEMERHKERLQSLSYNLQTTDALMHAMQDLARAFDFLGERENNSHYNQYKTEERIMGAELRIQELEEAMEHRMSMIRSTIDIIENLIPNPSKEIQAVLSIAKQLTL